MRPEQHCKHETGSTTYREGSGPAGLDVAGGLRCEQGDGTGKRDAPSIAILVTSNLPNSPEAN
jgi:hypothetical protein